MASKATTSARGMDLAGMMLLHFFLTVFTLGMYYFWGKTKVRNYLWSVTEVDGVSLSYHGTGGELFYGFLKALLIFGTPTLVVLMLCASIKDDDIRSAIFVVFLVLPSLLFMKPLVFYAIRRYLASRSSLRGIRFSLRGSSFGYAVSHATWITVAFLSFGLLYPFARVRLWRRIVSEARYGEEQLDFQGSTWDIFWVWIACLVLAVPTLTISLFYYRGYQLRYLLSKTLFQGKPLAISCSATDILIYRFLCKLILVFTFGLGLPWVLARRWRFWSEHLSISPEIDYQAIIKSAAKAPSGGEGIASVIGSGLDF